MQILTLFKRIIRVFPEFTQSVFNRYYYYTNSQYSRKKFIFGFISILSFIKTALSLLRLTLLLVIISLSVHHKSKAKEQSALFIIDIKLPINRISNVLSKDFDYKDIYFLSYSDLVHSKLNVITRICSLLLSELYLQSILKAINFNHKLFVIEGDKPDHILINSILYILNNCRIGMVQWSSYIYLTLTPQQNFLPYDYFILKDMLYKPTILSAKLYVKNPRFTSATYDRVNLTTKNKSKLFFVGQPFELLEKLPSHFFNQKHINYIQALRIVFNEMRIASKSKDIVYIKHPKENNIADIHLDFSEQIYLDEIYEEIHHDSVFYGFYSSLLAELYRSDVNLVLCCDNYNNTIFESIINNSTSLHLPLSTLHLNH